ncbi:MOSC domain-containing protein [Streptomyces sp. B-S-A8]|uniref:MOSC domain-containing protein n=1 Tax=Streptomyces solicavernae TaxID=3043614 RepID=A0ABT6RY48_9ACTN|nr:MOSC domain-containing protein [Streptomyces sp. B-S-A8]MDI3389360.1 MOSC domain-containing protein [Streptomyces sp. B-S-A8]
MVQAQVTGLFRYPVKSMRGESVPEAQVDQRGIDGDRQWGVAFDDGRVASGKTWKNYRRFTGLLDWTAQTSAGHVEVRTPEGERFTAGSTQLDRLLTESGGAPVRMAREAPTGVAHHDVAALHLLSESTLQALAALLPTPQDAVTERFRPNLLLGGELTQRPETQWVGHRVQIGEQVILEVTEPTERCVMTTLAQHGIPASKAVLKTLAREFDSCLGVYARVVRTGTIRTGDPLVLLND